MGARNTETLIRAPPRVDFQPAPSIRLPFQGGSSSIDRPDQTPTAILLKAWLEKRNSWEAATAILLAIFLVLIAVTFRDYGVSWDDEFSRIQGADFVRWYASRFHDRSVLSPVTSEYIYGAFFNGPAAAFAALRPFPPYESIHLAIALVGLLGLFVAFKVGQLLGGSRAGFFSAVILILTPAYYGHSFINSKDLPFAVFYLAAIYFLLRLYDYLPRPGVRRIALTGVGVGLPIAIRVGGVMVLGYVAVLALVWHLAQHSRDKSYRMRDVLRDMRQTIPAVAAICIIAWVVMIIWWPFAQIHPISNPLYAIRVSTSFNGAGFTNLFRGEFIPSPSMPRDYVPAMLLMSLPEFYAIGIGCSLIAAAGWIRRSAPDPGNRLTDHRAQIAFFAFVVLFPILAAVILRPTVYDRARLFLFVVPPLAVLSSLGISWFFSLDISRYVKGLGAMTLCIVAIVVAADMVNLHPYQYAYFNRESGGLRGAYGSYDTEYWGTSYKEGMDWLSANYKTNAAPRSIRVANPSNSFLTSNYIDSLKPATRRFVQVKPEANPDIVLAITRWNGHLIYGSKVLHVIERMGTPLLYVIEADTNAAVEDSIMRVGVSRLYMERNPSAAAQEFAKVLAITPTHYGAMISLAAALDATGRSREADGLWKSVLESATRSGDSYTVEKARRRLGGQAFQARQSLSLRENELSQFSQTGIVNVKRAPSPAMLSATRVP